MFDKRRRSEGLEGFEGLAYFSNFLTNISIEELMLL